MPRNPQNLFLGGQESNKGFREGLRRVDKLRETSRSRWEGPGAGALEARPGPPTWLQLSSPCPGSRLTQPGESPRRPKFAADSAGCQRQADRSWRRGPGQGWTPPPGPPKQPIPGGRGEGPGRSLPTPPGPDHHPVGRPPARATGAPRAATPSPELPGGAHDPQLVTLRREKGSPTPSAKRPKWRTYQAGLDLPPPSLRPPRSQSRARLRPLPENNWPDSPAPDNLLALPAGPSPLLRLARDPCQSNARGAFFFPWS